MRAPAAVGPSVLFGSPPYVSIPIFRATSNVNSVSKVSLRLFSHHLIWNKPVLGPGKTRFRLHSLVAVAPSTSSRACHHSIPLSIDGLHDLREQNLALGG